MKQLKINFCSESGIGEGIGGSKTTGRLPFSFYQSQCLNHDCIRLNDESDFRAFFFI